MNNFYNHKKTIHKLYNESVYGNIKGDIYNELSELRIDNGYIKSVATEPDKKTVLFTIDNIDYNKTDLKSQIKEVIRSFISKNISNWDQEFENFINGDLICDFYEMQNVLIVQL